MVTNAAVTIGVPVVVPMLMVVVGVVVRMSGSISVVVETSNGSFSDRPSERYPDLAILRANSSRKMRRDAGSPVS